MPGGVRAERKVAIRAWDGTKWVAPKYNIGTEAVPDWRAYGDQQGEEEIRPKFWDGTAWVPQTMV